MLLSQSIKLSIQVKNQLELSDKCNHFGLLQWNKSHQNSFPDMKVVLCWPWIKTEQSCNEECKTCLSKNLHTKRMVPIPIRYFLFFVFVFYFLAALGLCCCARAFCSCSKRGLLTAVASLVVEHGLQVHGFSSCSMRAQQLRRTGLVALWHVGSSQTRDRTRVRCIGRQILNHCATREVPNKVLLVLEIPLTLDC